MRDRPKDSTPRNERRQNLDPITIVAVRSLKDLPDPDREAARRWIEKTKPPKLGKYKNPRTSMCPFAPNASEEQIAKKQDEMLAELGVRDSAVWAAYWGAPKEGDRIWVTGVPGAYGGLSALYAHIRDEAKFKAEIASTDVEQRSRVSAPESSTPESKAKPDRKPEGRRQAIDAFISSAQEFGHKITRKDIWTVAGYKDRTEFERFQRNHRRATKSAAKNFTRVLDMKPEDFVKRLKLRSK